MEGTHHSDRYGDGRDDVLDKPVSEREIDPLHRLQLVDLQKEQEKERGLLANLDDGRRFGVQGRRGLVLSLPHIGREWHVSLELSGRSPFLGHRQKNLSLKTVAPHHRPPETTTSLKPAQCDPSTASRSSPRRYDCGLVPAAMRAVERAAGRGPPVPFFSLFLSHLIVSNPRVLLDCREPLVLVELVEPRDPGAASKRCRARQRPGKLRGVGPGSKGGSACPSAHEAGKTSGDTVTDSTDTEHPRASGRQRDED